MPRITILSRTRRSLKLHSLPTLSQRLWTKPEDGSTLCLFWPPTSSILHHGRISLFAVSFSQSKPFTLFEATLHSNLLLSRDGKKMSKSQKNYPDPNIILDQYGADALRLFLINSPVVRGDNLRFREAGVREVVSRVLLPWLNSFRFFLGQAALLKKETGQDFYYDGTAAQSSNVMDRWILARCQSLIQLVQEEMSAYRLYTVVPSLLELIDELTNWYIRFNRRRLKGESGSEEATMALTCLFEALLTLSRTLVSYTWRVLLMIDHAHCCLNSLLSLLSLPKTSIKPCEPSSARQRSWVWVTTCDPSTSCPSQRFAKSTSILSFNGKSLACKPSLSSVECSETSTRSHSR